MRMLEISPITGVFQNDLGTLESNLTVTYGVEHIHTTQPGIPTSRYRCSSIYNGVTSW